VTDDFESILRRSFIAVATTDYKDHRLRALPGVADEVRALSRWLCAKKLGHRRFATPYPELARNPTIEQIEAVLKRPERDWNDGDAAVVFVSGHGLANTDGHWIAVTDTDTDRPRRTAIGTRELVGWLRDTEIDHLLVILDLCHAGAAGFDTVRLPEFPPTWIVLASTSPDQIAATGELAAAITGFVADLDSPEGERFDHGPYLRVEQFLREVQDRLPGQRLHFLHTAIPDSGPSPCLPNPRHVSRPPLVSAARRDLAIRREDLDAHWAPKAAGSESAWLFTGRAQVLQHLIAFLEAGPGQAPVVVVTGAAGSGKSAVLGRLVTLSDPTFRAKHRHLVATIPSDLQPPEGSIDVAVLATGKLPHEVLGQILEALDIPASTGHTGPTLDDLRRRLTAWLATRAGALTVVLDALDEAKNPVSILDDVLIPIVATAAPGAVRLVVGVRSPGTDNETGVGAGVQPAPIEAGRALADRVVVALDGQRLAIDEPPWWREGDLADYARDILMTTRSSPYTHPHDHELARQVATELADRARKSFLVTRLAASTLAAADAVIDPYDSVWHQSLNDGVLGVFRNDLHAALPDPDERLKAIHLLRAVAFAYGRGLPWSQIWPLVANAVADRPGTYGDSDIATLLSSRLSGYLVRDHEDGVTVYRIFHDALRTTLRDSWQQLHYTPTNDMPTEPDMMAVKHNSLTHRPPPIESS